MSRAKITDEEKGLSLIRKHWSLIATAVAVVVWLIRLEGKVDSVEKISELGIRRIDQTMDRIATGQEKQNDRLSNIESRLSEVVGFEKGRGRK